MMPEWIGYRNGTFVPRETLSLAIHDAGVVHGAIITDRFRTWNGQFFRPLDHLNRFTLGLKTIGVQLQLSLSELLAISHELLKLNQTLLGGSEAIILWVGTPGPIGSLLGKNGNGPGTLIAYCFPLSFERFRIWAEQGIDLMTSTSIVPSYVIPSTIKHRSRLHWWLADQNRADTQVQLLYVECESNHVRETSVANVIISSQGVIYSPPWDRILPGIMLNTIREISKGLGIPWVESEFPLSQFKLEQIEMMLCNSSFGILKARSINGDSMPTKESAFDTLNLALTQLIGIDPISQILDSR
jgi:branched-chain amino acid aminotransferase